MISDGVRNGIQGGVEEVAVIALMQALRPKSSMAKLLFLPAEMGLFWNKYFDTEERQDYHKKKMASKIERASGQLKALGLETGVVRHLEYKWDPKEEKEEGEEEVVQEQKEENAEKIASCLRNDLENDAKPSEVENKSAADEQGKGESDDVKPQI